MLGANQGGFYHRNAVHQRHVDVPKQAFEGGAARMPPQLRMVASEALSSALAADAHAASNCAVEGREMSVSLQSAARAEQTAAVTRRDSCSGAGATAASPACDDRNRCAAQDGPLLPLMRQAFQDAQSLRWAIHNSALL